MSEKSSGSELRTGDEPFEPQPPRLSRRANNPAVQQVTRVLAFLVIVGAVALGTLLLVTPSASKATARARLQAAAHGISYPGPPPPRRFTEALVATEDQRFYSPFDPGIDPLAIVRAALNEIAGYRGDPGGSTIAQQLAKMLYTTRRDGPVAKMEHVALAIKLSFAYSKSQILSMYAEAAYFGGGYYGLAAASCGYFGLRPADLTWEQAAMLAGVVNAPTADDPRTHPHAARSREKHVLDRLVAVGDLTRSQAKATLAQPLALVRTKRCGRS
jgi:membrane carboxypeptidase/penicillin-binding protein PbpC